MKKWEVWYAKFPYEDDKRIEKVRPIVVLRCTPKRIMAMKLTSHKAREYSDVPIKKWKYTGLIKPTTARTSKHMYLERKKLLRRIGILHNDDRQEIAKRYA